MIDDLTPKTSIEPAPATESKPTEHAAMCTVCGRKFDLLRCKSLNVEFEDGDPRPPMLICNTCICEGVALVAGQIQFRRRQAERDKAVAAEAVAALAQPSVDPSDPSGQPAQDPQQELWFAGHTNAETPQGNVWEIQGVFATKDLALQACLEHPDWWIAPLTLGQVLPLEPQPWPSLEWPAWDKAMKEIAGLRADDGQMRQWLSEIVDLENGIMADECFKDHHGICQAHLWWDTQTNECTVDVVRKFLALSTSSIPSTPSTKSTKPGAFNA